MGRRKRLGAMESYFCHLSLNLPEKTQWIIMECMFWQPASTKHGTQQSLLDSPNQWSLQLGISLRDDSPSSNRLVCVTNCIVQK
jgi:hypothetical protein